MLRVRECGGFAVDPVVESGSNHDFGLGPQRLQVGQLPSTGVDAEQDGRLSDGPHTRSVFYRPIIQIKELLRGCSCLKDLLNRLQNEN